MPKLLIAFASATLLLASSGIWKANAATIANAGTLAPLTKSYAPAEKVAYRHRYARRHYRRGYRRGYYGHGLRLRLSALLRLRLPTPVLRLRLQAIRLLRLWLETWHHHRYRTRLGLALLRAEKPQLGRADEQLRQLGEVARQPPCLVHGEHSGCVASLSFSRA